MIQQKRDANVRGSPSPWVMSTKWSHPVTFISLKGYNPQHQCCHIFLSTLLAISLTESIYNMKVEGSGY